MKYKIEEWNYKKMIFFIIRMNSFRFLLLFQLFENVPFKQKLKQKSMTH